MSDLLTLAMPTIKNIALAVITLVVGLIAIKRLGVFLEGYIKKSKLDATLKPFIQSILSVSLKVLLVISVVKILGIDTTSFIAVIASAGLAVGLAFQGTLSNFAGGMLLLTLRPFRVGDFIEATGFSGTVEAIQLLYTHITTPDNRVIYIPNGKLSNESIMNYSIKDTRRAEIKLGVGYENDTKVVEAIIQGVIADHPLVLKDPTPFVRLSEHRDSAIIFTVRVWVKASDYWTVYFDLIENCKKKLDEENISIPYPQMDVHIKQND